MLPLRVVYVYWCDLLHLLLYSSYPSAQRFEFYPSDRTRSKCKPLGCWRRDTVGTGQISTIPNWCRAASKLVARIEAGEFIKMSDLLDHLGTLRSEEQKPYNLKRKVVTTILEWVKCFSIYKNKV